MGPQTGEEKSFKRKKKEKKKKERKRMILEGLWQ